MKWYSVESSVESIIAESVDVEMIRHLPVKDMIQIRYITLILKLLKLLLLAIMDVGVIIEEWEKLEANASNALL